MSGSGISQDSKYCWMREDSDRRYIKGVVFALSAEMNLSPSIRNWSSTIELKSFPVVLSTPMTKIEIGHRSAYNSCFSEFAFALTNI